jgi:hypothetical protein
MDRNQGNRVHNRRSQTFDLFDIRCVALSVQNNRIAINPASKTNEKGGHDWNGALNGARRKGSHFLNVRKQINIRW